MPISVEDLAKKLDIAPEAVTLHAMDLNFEIGEDEMVSDEVAAEIKKIETGDEVSQTEHELEEALEREVIQSQQKKTAGSQKKVQKKQAEKKKAQLQAEQEKEIEVKKTDDGHIILPEEMTVRDLAVKIDKPIPIVLVKLKQNGIVANLKEPIDYETAAILATELGVLVKRESAELSGEDLFRGNLKDLLAGEEKEHLDPRPPVISIMGHVDHGKTTLLDFIRKAKVAESEAGGITQRIGAYQIHYEGEQKMTFLDTPGHEAFTKMRARGAKATDIAILVVAATEGLKPQSIEAIHHAREAEIPIVVAINKTDLPGADPEKVKKELAANEVNPEDWGGDTPCVAVSAKTGAGVEKLLETVHLVAELQELRANGSRTAIATVIESEMTKQSGVSATVLVNTGTLQMGDRFVIYDQWGRIRSMRDFAGKMLKSAPPSMPVQISGLPALPKVGDLLQVVRSEKEARKKAELVAGLSHEDQASRRKKVSLATLKTRIAEGKMDQLKLVVKADLNGVVEAICAELEKCRTEESFAKVVHWGVGEITESDVLLASAGDGVLISFGMAVPARIEKLAKKEGVRLFSFDIIYKMTEKITEMLLGMDGEESGEEIVGRFEIKAQFAANKKMAVLGGEVVSGKVRGKCHFRLLGNLGENEAKEILGTGKVESVQLGQKAENEINEGVECGIKVSHEMLVFEEGQIVELFVPAK